MSLLVAVLSDTHIPSRVIGLPPRVLPREIFPYLEKADLILYAGDIVEANVLKELAVYAPVRAVKGDGDAAPSVIHTPETLEFEFGGIPVAMIHDSGSKRGRRNRIRRRFPHARVVIFGHSHIPGLEDEDGLLLLNPGSPTGKRLQPEYTFALLHIEKGNVRGEIVDLRSGECHSAGHYPPLSTKTPKSPKGTEFTTANKNLLRERADHECQVCSSTESLQVVHIVPGSEGGRGTVENGQVLCRSCHMEKTNKDRRRRELNGYLKREPTRTVPSHVIDWVFDTLSAWGASLPVQREEVYGLAVERLINTLREKEAEHLALDLVRGNLSGTHDKHYGIDRWGE